MKQVGILYSTFVCVVAGITGVIVFFLIQRERKKREIEYSQNLDYFCFLSGLTWFFVGARSLFTWLNMPEVEIFIYQWLIGPLTFIHLIPAFYYVAWSFFEDRKVIIFFRTIFVLIALMGIVFLFKDGFVMPEPDYWGNSISMKETSENILIYALFIPGFLFIIIELIRRLRRWVKTKNPKERQLFGFALGLFIYAITATIDALAMALGWLMVLARTGVMFSSLTIYFFAIWDQ
ncbi:MAG: hypothetical protein GF370_00080 [Candidatus Nealsonbacteria bacterium]|nr:hypothetical protein [Candidatus Nealsonbacteria bacterium]